MTISFKATSTFGRYALRQLYEGLNPYLVAQLLNVPTSVTGDRSTWTWDANWKNYAIPGAFTGTGGSLNLTSIGNTPPSEIVVYDPDTSAFAGAYYDGDYIADNRYLRLYNNSANAVTFTHAVFFVKQPNVTTTSSLVNLNTSLVFVRPWTTNESSTTVNAFSYLFMPFSRVYGSGGTSITVASDFQEWVQDDKNSFEDLIEYGVYQAPYPIAYDIGYRFNDETSPYFAQAYKDIIGVSESDTVTTFFAELLNVTGAEPGFEADWSSWSTYRINRYSTASVTPQYKYETKQNSYEIFDPALEVDLLVTWTGLQISLKNYMEFIVTPPASSSYTFTHIAVFINEADSPPPAGTVYNYSNPDKFIGVIKLPSSVTMSSTSTNRAYPFNFGFMYQPVDTYEEITGS
jgi:hypothetical protein